jgi:glyoxylase-like metal-dependent hydrolase (beta-lactamase superfamily II)
LQANCYLVWDQDRRCCAVDPGGEPERIGEVVAERELSLEAILVTHGHFDHMEGVAGLAAATGAVVYCSSLVAPIASGKEPCSASGIAVPAVPAEAVRVVTDGSAFGVGELSIKVLGTPGHTPGDITYDIDGRLFCGDLLFRGSVGRTDFPGGDFEQLLESVGRLAALYPPETAVYPGHMEATSLGDEIRHNPFLRGLRPNG